MQQLLVWMQHLDATQIFACSFLGMITLAWLIPTILQLLRTLKFDLVRLLFLKYIRYRNILERHRFSPAISFAEIICALVLLAANFVVILVPGPSREQAAHRSGVLCLIHMIPLFFSTNLSFLADFMHLDLAQVKLLHGLVGGIALLEVAIHVGFSVQKFNLSSIASYWAIAAVTAFCLTFTLPLIRALRRRYFEFFIISHYALAGIVVAGSWIHIIPKNTFSRFYLFATIGLVASSSLARCLLCLLRNFESFKSVNHGPRLPRLVCVDQGGDLYRLTILLPKRFSWKAGQHVYLWAPGSTFSAWIESHPFIVIKSTIEGDEKTHREMNLIVAPMRGWTSLLISLAHAQSYSHTSHVCILDGPYGSPPDVHNFGTVLMLASGMGFVAHLPLLHSLIEKWKAGEGRTRKVIVVWQLSNSVESFLAEEINKLLDMTKPTSSTEPFLTIQLHATARAGTYINSQTGRLKWNDRELDCEACITRLLDMGLKGVIVTVSVPYYLRRRVRKCISSTPLAKLRQAQPFRVVELDYQPLDLKASDVTGMRFTTREIETARAGPPAESSE